MHELQRRGDFLNGNKQIILSEISKIENIKKQEVMNPFLKYVKLCLIKE